MSSLSDFLLSVPDIAELSLRSHILLVAYYLRRTGVTAFSGAALRKAFSEAGLPPPANLNIRLSQLSKGKKAPLVLLSAGTYSLSLFGVQEVDEFLESPLPAGRETAAGIGAASKSLRELVGRMATDAERQFLAEAVACVQVGAKRAAVVMVWLLTVDHLYRYVLAEKLTEFNAALANRQDAKGLAIATKDDFTRIRDEKAFIETLVSANVISKDVRKILDHELGFRNSCGHPADIFIPDGKVVASIEDLVHNVILKYPLGKRQRRSSP